jgi:SAM-dependent methyltransferase
VRAENAAITSEDILQKYAGSLRAQGIPDSEITRRVTLIRTERQALEIDMWNRVYTGSNSEFNQAPNASAVRDADYDFGKERFDLILFSWSMPLVPIESVIDSLKPGGTVIMECAANYVGRNGMLKMFDALQITRYEIVRAKADWYNRIDTDVLRMVAVKPR